jgi:hypothetical protein
VGTVDGSIVALVGARRELREAVREREVEAQSTHAPQDWTLFKACNNTK